ncbi:MAG: RNA polymerase sigma factor [Cyclobacteriaceae bacterium]
MPASQKMYRYALSILGDSENAHDVVQECLMKIWDKREKLADVQNPESWAMRITRNQCYDWVKTNRFTILSEKEMIKPDPEGADQLTLVNDHNKWLEDVLKTLPEKQREVFHLREVEEMPYQDIADILSLSLSEVKVYLHRARQKIKLFIEKVEAYGIAN